MAVFNELTWTVALAVIAAISVDSGAGAECDQAKRKSLLTTLENVLKSAKQNNFGHHIKQLSFSQTESSVTPETVNTRKINVECPENSKKFKITAKSKTEDIATFVVKGTQALEIDGKPASESFKFTTCIRSIEVDFTNELPIIQKVGSTSPEGSCTPAVEPKAKSDILLESFKSDWFVWNTKGFDNAVRKLEMEDLLKPENRDLAQKVAACFTDRLSREKFPVVNAKRNHLATLKIYCNEDGFESFAAMVFRGDFGKKPAEQEMAPSFADCLKTLDNTKELSPSSKVLRIWKKLIQPLCQFDTMIDALSGNDKKLREMTECIVPALDKLKFPVRLEPQVGRSTQLFFECQNYEDKIESLRIDDMSKDDAKPKQTDEDKKKEEVVAQASTPKKASGTGSGSFSYTYTPDPTPEQTAVDTHTTVKVTVETVEVKSRKNSPAIREEVTYQRLVEKCVEKIGAEKTSPVATIVADNISTLLTRGCAIKPIFKAFIERFWNSA